MRNLKRALSLTLASIMLLGMMVVGSSAASYQDVTDEHNVEAIEVLQAVGIMVGDEGNFNPEKNVTRNEMAVIMSNLMDYRVATYAGTSPFTDVPSWAEPYVAACYTNGITSGTSATTYNGSGNVTTAQAALMVMKALGYFQNVADFGSDWQLETTRQANKIDLLVGVKASVKEAMTRNDVARLVLNGLEAGTVEADNSNSINVSVGGEMVSIGGTKYDFVTSTESYAYAINPDQSTTNYTDATASVVELGEKLYQGSLTKKAWEKDTRDDFGRPADHWQYEGKEIGTYTKDADTSFNECVTSKALYSAVGAAACVVTGNHAYTWTVSVDGDEVGYNGADLNANKTDDNNCFLVEADKSKDDVTGNGALTQVFVDGVRRTVKVSVIHYYAAEVLRVNNDGEADRSITLSDLDKGPSEMTTKDVFETADFAEDDIVVYSWANKAIQEVFATERIEGKVTQARTNQSDSKGDHFTMDETKYKYNMTVTSDAPRRLTTENVSNNMVGYLDQFGFVAYIDETAVTYDYAYVLSLGVKEDDFDDNRTRANGRDDTLNARLVLTDGTIVKATTDNKANEYDKLLHKVVPYSVDSNGVYHLNSKLASGTSSLGDVEIKTGVAGVTAGSKNYTANANTIFILADSDKNSYDDFNFRIYTGIKNVPDVDGKAVTYSAVAVGADGVAKVVYIQDGDVSGLKNVIFIRADKNAKLDKVEGNNKNYVINAVEDGEAVTLLVKEDSEAAKTLVTEASTERFGYGPFNSDGTRWIVAAEYLTRNSDGVVTNVKLYDKELGDASEDRDPKDGYLWTTGTDRERAGTVGLGTGEASERFGYGDNTVVVRYDLKSNTFYPEKSAKVIKDDADDQVLGIFDNRALTGICYVNTKDGAGEAGSGETGGSTPGQPAETKDNVKPAKGEPVVMNGTTYGKLGTDRLGNLSMSISFKAPAWAEGVNPNAKLDVTIKDDVGTVKELKDQTATESEGVYTFTANGSGDLSDLETAIADGKIDESKLTVEFKNVKWTNAAVKYVYDTETGADASAAMGTINNANDSFKTMKVGAAEAGFKFTFTLPTATRQLKTGVTKASYEIVGATKATGETVETTGDITDASAVTFTAGLKANGGDYVYVIIKGTEAKPAAATKTVSAASAINVPVEFAVVTGKTPSQVTAVPEGTTWSNGPVSAATTDTVLVRAKDTTVGLKTIATSNKDDGSSITLGAAVIDNSASGVLKFAGPSDNTTIYKVTTDAVEVTGVYVSKDMTVINAILGAASTDRAKIANAIMDYINKNQDKYSLKGVTAAVKKDARGEEVVGVTLTAGSSVDVLFSGTNTLNADIAANMAKTKVNGKDIIVRQAASTAKVTDALTLEGITMEGTAANVFVVLDKGSGTYAGMASNGTTVLTGVNNILTNGTKGYAIAKATGNIAIDNTTPVYSVASVTFTGAFKDTPYSDTNGVYLPIGEAIKITVTLGGASMTAANTNGIKFIADTADQITHGNAVGAFGSGAIDKDATDGSNKVEVTVTITAGTATAGSIKLKAAANS